MHFTVDCNDGDLSCYFTRQAIRWFEARNRCAAENGDLAVLTSDIYRQLKNQHIIRTNRDYYIGLRNRYLQWSGPGPGKNFEEF